MPVHLNVISLSGGKDSTATALLALELYGSGACRFVFADTGNEHQATYDYSLGFFHQGTQGHVGKDPRIYTVLEWARTDRGGRQFSLLSDLDEPTACSSVHGLCE